MQPDESTYTSELLELSANRRDVFAWTDAHGNAYAVDLNRIVHAIYDTSMYDTFGKPREYKLELYTSPFNLSEPVTLTGESAKQCWLQFTGQSS